MMLVGVATRAKISEGWAWVVVSANSTGARIDYLHLECVGRDIALTGSG